MQSSKSRIEPLRLAFLGGGVNSAVGNTHRIASQMDGHWKLSLGVFSRDKEMNARSASSYGIDDSACCSDLEELIQRRDEYDAVSILTPTTLHFDQISLLAKSDIQIISEKSLVATVEEGMKIQQLESDLKRRVFVTFNYTAYPMIRELKARIMNNSIGNIISVQVEMPQEGFLKLSADLRPPNVQQWRTRDGELSTLSLDLGVHTQNLIHFLTGMHGEEFVGVKTHSGLVSNATDYISALGRYQGGIEVGVWYGKTSLGSRNGLKVRVFGEHGSYEWQQIYPDRLFYADQIGNRFTVDTGSPHLILANESRYQRFKPGHPTGFIEAFANYYVDLYNVIRAEDLQNHSEAFTFSAMHAVTGLKEIRAIEKSSLSRKWETV